jgi:hypothetical protein
VTAAAINVAHVLAAQLDQVPTWSDDLVALAARGGADAVRAFLKGRMHDTRQAMTDALAAIADSAETDEDGDDEI